MTLILKREKIQTILVNLPVIFHLQNVVAKVDQHDCDHEEDDPGVHVDQVKVPELNGHFWITVCCHERCKPAPAELMEADFQAVNVVA